MGARLKAILLWGVILFIINYIVLYILVVAQVLGSIGPTIYIVFNLVTALYFSYKGTMAFSSIGNNEKNRIMNSQWYAGGIGLLIVVIATLLFSITAYLFSGEFDFRAFGIIAGVFGGLMARNKLQGKKLFG